MRGFRAGLGGGFALAARTDAAGAGGALSARIEPPSGTTRKRRTTKPNRRAMCPGSAQRAKALSLEWGMRGGARPGVVEAGRIGMASLQIARDEPGSPDV